MEQYYFISFDSTNHAMEAEDFLKKNNYSITVLPTPREVSASCGLSIKFNSGGLEEIKDIIENGSVKAKGIYSFTRENNKKIIEKV
jgi:Protein of unknown function (DUF3343).